VSWRSVLLGLTALMIGACAGAPQAAPPPEPASPEPTALESPPLPDHGPAPEIAGSTWINSDQALTLADLQGRVVLLDMWTFGCINCQHVIPSLRSWHERYAGQGLVIVGNHYPEFGYERDLSNLRDAVSRLQIPYPVVQDNDGTNWRSYKNHYWPTLYLIDKRGHLRYQHIGEGAYAETEAAIRALLAEPTTLD
jgi:thiol-disulfide isomerase/thioredoxin